MLLYKSTDISLGTELFHKIDTPVEASRYWDEGLAWSGFFMKVLLELSSCIIMMKGRMIQFQLF